MSKWQGYSVTIQQAQDCAILKVFIYTPDWVISYNRWTTSPFTQAYIFFISDYPMVSIWNDQPTCFPLVKWDQLFKWLPVQESVGGQEKA